MTAGLPEGEVHMEKFTSKIKLVLILIALFAIVDSFDDHLLILAGVRDNSMGELIFDTSISFIYIILVFWAFYSGKKVIIQYKREKKHYQRLITLSPEAIFVFRQGKVVFVNKAGVTLLAAKSIADLLDYNWRELIHYDTYNRENLLEEFKYDTNQLLNHQIRARRLDGKVIDVEFTSTKVEFNGMPAWEVIARDITFRKKQEKILEQLAFQDELTKLPNRRAFLYKLEQLLSVSERYKNTFALLFIDLDGFKKINDSLGHEAGDELLKKVSIYLKKSVREKDTVARLAGDEFTILLPDANEEECMLVAGKIIENLTSPFLIEGKEVRVTPSIGISLYPQNGEDALTLLKQADMAMYQAKQKGKNQFQFIEDESIAG